MASSETRMPYWWRWFFSLSQIREIDFRIVVSPSLIKLSLVFFCLKKGRQIQELHLRRNFFWKYFCFHGFAENRNVRSTYLLGVNFEFSTWILFYAKLLRREKVSAREKFLNLLTFLNFLLSAS